MKKFISFSAFFAFLFLFSGLILAQDIKFDPKAQVPLDPKVIYGKLDNGLTYYIRENKNPKDRAEFFLVEDAGAIEEDSNQNGLAHFCEHMAFNGTKHFEKKQIINYLQSIGMKFGPEINAFTNTDETNYMLQKVPTTDPKIIDSALLILLDWSHYVTYDDKEIDDERGVIHEEWRQGRNAMFRMMIKANKVLYKGSKYADHDVIGNIHLIDTFHYDVLKKFYHDWYRPDLQAVVAVGDFDGKEIERKIKDLFSQVPANTDERKEKLFPVPDNQQTLVAIESDKEAMYPIVQVYYKHDPVKDKDMGYYRKTILEQLFAYMFNNRLQELTQAENPPFVFARGQYTDLVKTKDAFISLAVAKDNDLQTSLNTLLRENERLKRYGFTPGEFERAQKSILSMLEQQYNEREKQESDKLIWQYYQNFLTAEPSPGIEFDYKFMHDMLPGVKLEEVNNLSKEWITDDNRVVIIMAPEKEGLVIPDTASVLAAVNAVATEKIDPYVDKVSNKPLVSDEPTPGKVAKKARDKKLGTIDWTLSNGVKVIIKPTDFKQDEIQMTAYSLGGTSLYDVKDLISAQFAAGIANESGLDGFDNIELQKKLAGINANASPRIGGLTQDFSGNCAPKDMETMLQLVYLYFTEPRLDKTGFNSFMNRTRTMVANRELDPTTALRDTISVTLANYNPRVRPMTVKLLDEAQLNVASKIYRERFGTPGNFTFYFVGNIDPERDRAMIEKYLGGLPMMKSNETWKDDGIRPPKGRIEKVLHRDMEVPKGTVYVTYTGEFDYDNFADRLNLTALCDILDVRYTETIREEQGGSYGVACFPSMQKYPYENYQVTIYFNCDPENADKLKAIVYDEINKIKANGPEEKDLKGVIENKLKEHQENLRKNEYWLSTLKSHDYMGLDYSDVNDFDKYVNGLSIESIKAAANKFFGDNVIDIMLLPTSNKNNEKNPMIKEEGK